MARYDDLNTSSIAYATLVSCLGFFLLVVFIQALTFGWINGEDQRKLEASHYYSADSEIAAQKAKLNNYAQVEVEVIPPAPAGSTESPAPEKQTRIHIPVSQAQQLLKKELNKSN